MWFHYFHSICFLYNMFFIKMLKVCGPKNSSNHFKLWGISFSDFYLKLGWLEDSKWNKCLILEYVYVYFVYGGFLRWWYPTTFGFPTTNDDFGVFWGYHHLRKRPYIDIFDICQCLPIWPKKQKTPPNLGFFRRPLAKVIGARGETATANAMRSLAWEAWT